jgi:hypothetical protein
MTRLLARVVTVTLPPLTENGDGAVISTPLSWISRLLVPWTEIWFVVVVPLMVTRLAEPEPEEHVTCPLVIVTSARSISQSIGRSRSKSETVKPFPQFSDSFLAGRSTDIFANMW